MIKYFSVITGDVDSAIYIMRDVAQWCENTGKNMWKMDDLTKETLTKGLTPQNFCVGKVQDKGVSTMILQWHDPLFWPDIKDNESGFIHKLCVIREYAGLGISDKMVEYAKDECKRKGIRYLRLDTGWDRVKLCKHYEKLGFVKVGKKTIGTKDYALYEMAID